jgi:hypothetical protein
VHLSSKGTALDSSPPGKSQFSPTAPGWPPAKPQGRDNSALRDERDRDVLEHLEVSLDTLASRTEPGATAAAPERVPPNPHRVRPLKRFDGSVPRICHARVNSRLARSRPARSVHIVERIGHIGMDASFSTYRLAKPRAPRLIDKCSRHSSAAPSAGSALGSRCGAPVILCALLRSRDAREDR